MNMHNKLPDPTTADVYRLPVGGEAATGGGRRWVRPLLIVLAVLALAYGAYRMFGAKPIVAPVAAAVPDVTVITPGTRPVVDSVSAPGSIAARRDAAVGINGEGGRVTEVLVDPGQAVGKGQVLARIDSSVQEQQSVQMAASIRQAEADARLAASDLARAQALVEKGFISKADIEKRMATRDGADAKVALARAQLAENRARIDRLTVRAPAAGLVLSRSVETGQIVGPSSGALFRIAEGGVLEMRALVAEQDMGRLKPGMTAMVTPVGSTTEYPGKIWLIDPVIDAQSRQGIVRIAMAYSPGLRVGAFARARMTAGETSRPVLPQSAVLVDDKGSYVLVAGSDNRVARRSVQVGAVSDDGVSIASGIAGDERVVVSAGAFLRDGEKINPVSPPKAG